MEAGLVGNPLHVFGLIRRCLHSVDEIARFLEDRVEAKEKEEERRRQEKEEVVIDLDALSEDEEKGKFWILHDIISVYFPDGTFKVTSVTNSDWKHVMEHVMRIPHKYHI